MRERRRELERRWGGKRREEKKREEKEREKRICIHSAGDVK